MCGEIHPHFLPLTPAVFHMLFAITKTNTHGCAILKDVARRTEGRVVLGAGALYGIVKHCCADRLIEESLRPPPAAEDDEQQHYYRLTAFAAPSQRPRRTVCSRGWPSRTARTRRLVGAPPA